MFSFSSNHHNGIHSERFQRNNDKINTKIYLLVKPMEDSNFQPRGSFHGSIQLSYWACRFNQLNFTKNEKKLIGVEDGLAPSTSCIYNRRSSY